MNYLYDLSEIQRMDFKELRTAVQELYDKYVKLKRAFDDAINNIDESNLASTIIKKWNDYETTLRITAKGIESRVSHEDLENSLLDYSTIQQTAEQISMSVVSEREYVNKTTEELSSLLTMTAEKIETRVTKLKKTVDGNYEKMYSSLTQTAEQIETIVCKEITAYFEMSTMPTDENTTENQKSKLCKYNNVYYYFNRITKTWRKYQDGGVKTAFRQTADGFELNGCVSISGDLITNGTISAERIDTDSLSCTKLYGISGGYYAKIQSNSGDIGLFKPSARDNATVNNSDCIWGVYQSDVVTQVVNFYSYGHNYMGYNNNQKKIYPKGTWDFSSCNVIGFPQQA